MSIRSPWMLSAFLALALLVGNAPPVAAQKCTTDVQGPDDEPGQKDLDEFCLGGACGTGGQTVIWNFDDTRWSGSNTGDACALFDSDGDGNANFAVCSTYSGGSSNGSTPPVLSATTCYQCGDTRPDRCTSSVSIACTAACTASRPSDPFAGLGSHSSNKCAGPNCTTLDARATCCIKPTEFGGTAVLTDVCSYPSMQPNSDPSDCIVTVDCTTNADCDDHNPCTTDTCDATIRVCRHASAAAGTACGDPTSTVCNAADTCDGAGTCQPNVAPTTTQCRGTSGSCDVAAFCDGAGNCPANGFKPAGTACGDQTSSPCNAPDTCDGAGICKPNNAPTTTQCRSASGACDVAEFCDGAGSCPANGYKPAGTACGDPTNTVCNGADTCDGAGTCKTNVAPSTTQCRAASGACDVAEFCDGAGSCPANGYKPAGTACGDQTTSACNAADTCDGAGACQANNAPTTTQCRSASGACDVAAFCDGAGSCPANGYKPAGTACGDPTNTVCNGADSCDGAGTCKTNVAPTTTQCRGASGACDLAAFCDGAGNCPANGFKPAGTACGDQTTSACSAPDTCDASGTCQANNAPSTTQCRSASGACDVAEFCDGAGNCPANGYKPAGTACGDPTNTVCNAADTCDGTGTCKTNVAPSTTQCRAASGACDVAEFCDGAGNCPANGYKPAGTACGDSTSSACNAPDTCDGSGTCQANNAPTTTQCRSASGACDVAEFCDGAGNCPANGYKPAGTACGDPTSTICNGADTCDGAGVCKANNAATTTQCRAAAGQCDVAEFCDGAGSCPADALKPNGSSCNDGNACTGPNNTDTCQNGVCSGPPRTCDDGNQCTDDACNAASGCTFTPDDSNSCSDGNACTVSDHCSAGSCVGAARNCDDGLFCNGVEGCNAATGCTAGTPPQCGDGFGCTADSCSETLKRCLNEPNDAACNDANACTIDSCIGAGGDAQGCAHDVDLVSESDARAYGVSVKSLGVITVPPVPDTGQSGSPTQLAQVNAAPLAVIDLLTVSRSTASDASGASGTATAETAKVSLLTQLLNGGLVTARTVKAVSTCAANAQTASCSYTGSTLTGVKVSGQNLGTIVNPTVVNVNTGLVNLTVAFLEQVPSSGNVPGVHSAGLKVNAIHVFGTIAGGLQAIDVVVAHAEAEAEFGNATTCDGRPHVSGEAYVVGLDADETLVDPNHALVHGRALDVVLPSDGGTLDATQATVGPVGYGTSTLVSSGTANSHTTGSIDVAGDSGQSSSFAQVQTLRILDGSFTPALIAADLVRADCSAMADGAGAASMGDATIANLSILGVPICDALHLNPLCDPAPNTDLGISPLGTLIRLNEQRCENGGTLASGCSDGSVAGASGITVNAIHVYVLAFPNPLGLRADLVVSSAHCDAATAP